MVANLFRESCGTRSWFVSASRDVSFNHDEARAFGLVFDKRLTKACIFLALSSNDKSNVEFQAMGVYSLSKDGCFFGVQTFFPSSQGNYSSNSNEVFHYVTTQKAAVGCSRQ
jgi:hypothetical protein